MLRTVLVRIGENGEKIHGITASEKKPVLRKACDMCGGNCMNCYYDYDCDIWNDALGFHVPQVKVDTADMGLCRGRHDMPQAVDGFIFENEVNPLDTKGLEEQAIHVLANLDIKALNLYVTGLTVALVAVMNACRALDLKLTLYHFDRNSGSYYAQEVL